MVQSRDSLIVRGHRGPVDACGVFWLSHTTMAEGAVGQEQPGWENVSLRLEEADGKGLVPAETDLVCPSLCPLRVLGQESIRSPSLRCRGLARSALTRCRDELGQG